jgi:deoxycytidine triphosphate deaminase
VSGEAAAALSDGTILQLVDEGRIRIAPWDPGLVQPASVDVRLGDSFRVSTTTARRRLTSDGRPRT